MKYFPIILAIILSQFCFGQAEYDTYLEANRVDLLQETALEIGQAKMVGFGALHGSARTEKVEVILLKELVNHHNLKFYLPETDYSTAHYFQQFIETGDEPLLNELVIEYGTMVPQEKSIEVFEKWRQIRQLFLKNDVQVVGVDKIASYKFPLKHLLSITEESDEWRLRDSLELKLEDPETVWSIFENPQLKAQMKRFVEDYEANKSTYDLLVEEKFSFNHIIENIKHTYETYSREPFIFDNYFKLNERYTLDSHLHFARFGVFHLMKSKINNTSTFFSMLIKNGVYQPNEVLTIQGFLTQSSVMWNSYDRKGNIKYGTKKGYGIGDYWLEYFHEIKELKKAKLSDVTLFYLNRNNTPYAEKDEYQLIRVRKLLGKSGWYPTDGKSTLDYIDYAVLISNSPANRPLGKVK